VRDRPVGAHREMVGADEARRGAIGDGEPIRQPLGRGLAVAGRLDHADLGLEVKLTADLDELRNEPSPIAMMSWPARRRGFPPVWLAAVVLVSLSPDEGGALVITAPIAGQPQAASCVASLPWFGHEQGWYTSPRGTITTSNDGGWCDLQFIQFFRRIYTKDQPTISVVEPPSHGEATAERLSDRLALAYRPVPGFVGTDHFSVRTDGPVPHTIPIEVTVR